MNIFAIGDIHGCLNELHSLHKKILANKKFKIKEDLLIYLGDYIDRGSKSKQVIDEILHLKNKKIKTILLMGNHEEFMIDFLLNKINNLKNWLNFGADQTFRSYDIEVVDFIKNGFDDDVIDKLRKVLLEKMSHEHFNFFKNLELMFSLEQYLFVHAGVNPRETLKKQNKHDFLWSRSEEFFNKNFKFDKIVVHGHTPEKNFINLPYRINVDTGCYFSGKLSCVVLNDLDNKREFIDSK